jgi:predicted nucleotidyltransferase
MGLNELKEGDLKDVFTALEEAFANTGTDFYVIGALARDVWYARADKKFRGTRDVDFAVLIGSHEEYGAVRDYLKEHSQFRDTRENSFVMLSPAGVQVDILPFGEIEIDNGITLTGEGMTSIKVNGFREVYQSGTADMELVTGHQFKIATLPSIVLLKFIAFDDRPERRMKDARDIANIIDHFFELHADLIYDKHVDLFTEGSPLTLEDISAIVIGREIKEICGANEALLARLQTILQNHIAQAENSSFVRNMVAETGKDVELSVGYLKYLLSSLNS